MDTSVTQCDSDLQTNQPIVGKLLALNPAFPTIQLHCGDEVVIGRKAEADIVVPEAHVSSRHCKIVVSQEGDAILTDMSTNGTMINRKSKIHCETRSCPLQHGEEVSVNPPSVGSDFASFIYQDLRYPVSDMMVAEVSEEGVLSNFNFVKKLGAGMFGTVWLAEEMDTRERRAIKVIEKKKVMGFGKKAQQALNNEIQVLQTLNHPHAVSLFGAYETDNFVVLVLELATGGEFTDFLEKKGRPLTEDEARPYFYQILTALQYFHEHNVSHRDLKPSNILLAAPTEEGLGTIKITDFGLARIQGDQGMVTMCGTPNFIAPEVLRADHCPYDFTVDMWSAGVILYVMLSGCLPFEEGKNGKPLFRQLRDAENPDFELTYPSGLYLSSEAKSLVQSLIIGRERRITAEQALDHRWFTSSRKRDSNVLARVETLIEESVLCDQKRAKLEDVAL